MMEMTLDDRTTRCEVELGPMLAMAPVVSLSGDGGLPDDPEAAHLEAADELLHRSGMSLADCEVSRVYAGFDGGDDAVLLVVRVGRGVDMFALNEALTAVQLARGLLPSAQLDVVFQA